MTPAHPALPSAQTTIVQPKPKASNSSCSTNIYCQDILNFKQSFLKHKQILPSPNPRRFSPPCSIYSPVLIQISQYFLRYRLLLSSLNHFTSTSTCSTNHFKPTQIPQHPAFLPVYTYPFCFYSVSSLTSPLWKKNLSANYICNESGHPWHRSKPQYKSYFLCNQLIYFCPVLFVLSHKINCLSVANFIWRAVRVLIHGGKSDIGKDCQSAANFFWRALRLLNIS